MAIVTPSPTRKEAKQAIDREAGKFAPMVGRMVEVSFGPHSFVSTFTGFELGKIGDLVNKPEPREDLVGKMYTPAVGVLRFKDGQLVLVLEDIDRILLTLDQVRVIIGKIDIRLRRVD